VSLFLIPCRSDEYRRTVIGRFAGHNREVFVDVASYGIVPGSGRNTLRIVEQHRLLDLLCFDLDTLDLRPQRRDVVLMQFHLPAHAT